MARKYFAHALVLIDQQHEKIVHNNVVRALFGLIKVCKQINKLTIDKQEAKNNEILKIAQDRLIEIYSKNSTIDVSKLNVMKD